MEWNVTRRRCCLIGGLLGGGVVAVLLASIAGNAEGRRCRAVWDRDYYAALDCIERGELDKADGLVRSSLEAIEGVAGKSHFRYVKSLTALATVYYAQNRLDDAQKLYGEAAALARESDGLNVVERTAPVHGLASVEFVNEEYGPCERNVRYVISERENELGHTSEKLRSSLSLLRDTMRAQGKAAEASEIETRIAQLD